MITGIVNDRGESLIRLVVGDRGNQRLVVDAVLDTGYTGFLTLPPSVITALGLTWLGSEEGTLGDGSLHDFDVYSAQIIWDGAFRTIKVNESETQALIGIGLLYGYEVCIETIAGGMVKIMNLST
jgi:clan AA aspartic protease